MNTHTMLIFLCLMGISLYSSAQSNTTVNVLIKGQVIDSLTNETIPYATIKVLQQSNSTSPIKAIASNDNGKFEFTMNKKGDYLLSAEFIGKKTVVKPLTIGDTKTIDLGKILMPDDAQSLSEVVVSAQRPLVQVDLDKITYSMENDPEAKTNNVLEMLKKVPMVTVDGEENIQLKGSSNFKIYMNGKPSNMITNNPKDVLRSMPAGSVKDIQIITDPGAKYDAEGVAGIINIITHKDSSLGGYTATLNGHVDDMGSFGGGTYLMLKYGKVGFQGNYNYNEWKRPKGNYHSIREDLTNTTSGNINKYLSQIGTSKNNGTGQYGSGELSYEIDTLNLINIGFSRYYGDGKSTMDVLEEMKNNSNNLEYKYDMNSSSKRVYGGTDLSADYQRTFKKKDQLLTASYRLSINPADSKSNTSINNILGTIPSNRGIVTNRQFSDADMKEHTFQMDFVTPFGKVHNLEAGAKYIIRINESNSGKDTLNVAGTWDNIPDLGNNKFKHQQDILATYAGYSAKFKKWGLKTGLRYEATWLEARFPLKSEQNFKADYSNFVPSAMVTYQIKPMENIRMGYNMRISRPGIWQLNPYVNNSNPNFVQKGNPDLDAVKNHSINMNYNYFNPTFNMNVNLGYDFENNGVERITTIEDGKSISSYDNIGKRKNIGLSSYMNWSPTNKLRIYGNLSGRYVDIKSNNNQNFSNNGFTGNIYAGSQYTFPLKIRTNLSFGYYSPYISLQGKGSSYSFHSLSVSKDFYKDRLSIRFNAGNPFTKDREFRNKEYNPDLYRSESISTSRMRNFSISFSFKFGEMKEQLKKTRRGISNDDGMGSGQGGDGGGQSSGN